MQAFAGARQPLSPACADHILGEDHPLMAQSSQDVSIYDLFLDWVEPYSSVAHATGILCITCADIDPRNKGKNFNVRPVLIIPGPHQPKNMNTFLSPLLREARELWIQGIKVRERCQIRDESSSEERWGDREFVHKAILGALFADTPAR